MSILQPEHGYERRFGTVAFSGCGRDRGNLGIRVPLRPDAIVGRIDVDRGTGLPDPSVPCFVRLRGKSCGGKRKVTVENLVERRAA